MVKPPFPDTLNRLLLFCKWQKQDACQKMEREGPPGRGAMRELDADSDRA